jgi:hypothetical protein
MLPWENILWIFAATLKTGLGGRFVYNLTVKNNQAAM